MTATQTDKQTRKPAQRTERVRSGINPDVFFQSTRPSKDYNRAIAEFIRTSSTTASAGRSPASRSSTSWKERRSAWGSRARDAAQARRAARA